MRTFIILTILGSLLLPAFANAEPSYMEIGARGGIEFNNGSLEEDYDAAELYFLKTLPWGTNLGDQTTLFTRFDMGVTYLGTDAKDSAMVAIGGDVVLGFWDGIMEFEIGFRPTWMFEHEYDDDDFGGGMQFTSHAGLAFIWDPVVLNYRVQHTSNAGIYDENPGINMHMIGLGYRF